MSDSLKIKINSDVKIPLTPNFILIRTRKHITGYDSSVPIEDFTDDELKEIGQKWIENLISNAKMRRSMDRTQTPTGYNYRLK